LIVIVAVTSEQSFGSFLQSIVLGSRADGPEGGCDVVDAEADGEGETEGDADSVAAGDAVTSGDAVASGDELGDAMAMALCPLPLGAVTAIARPMPDATTAVARAAIHILALRLMFPNMCPL
jgi:hypothetical protein